MAEKAESAGMVVTTKPRATYRSLEFWINDNGPCHRSKIGKVTAGLPQNAFSLISFPLMPRNTPSWQFGFGG